MSGSASFYDYIVVGCGGIGSATLYWLTKRSKCNVLGLEQFRLGHDHGGSQDHSRMIRHAYHDEMYTRLTRAMFQAWAEVEEESGIKLVYKTGCVDIFKKETKGMESLHKLTQAMDQHRLPYERLTVNELVRRFPQFRLSDDKEVLFHSEGGLIDAALANSVHIQLAQAHGATVLEECSVKGLQPIGVDQCLVHTTRGVFKCRRVIITAGAWINQVLSSVNVEIPVTVTQEQVTYIATPYISEFTKSRFPIFSYYATDGFTIYGMPVHVNSCYKTGIDSVGKEVHPNNRSYIPDPIIESLLVKFNKEVLPKSDGPIKYTKTCLYTMTPDRNFVLDTLRSRGMPQVVVCCGAGHAFKFSGILGKILSDLTMYGRSQFDISEFKFEREAIQNRHFTPVFWRGDLRKAKL